MALIIQAETTISLKTYEQNKPQSGQTTVKSSKFLSRQRDRDKVFDLVPGATRTFDLIADGITGPVYVEVGCITPGESLQVIFGSDVTGITLVPMSNTESAYFAAPMSSTQITVVNVSTTTTISVSMTFLERVV